MAAMALEVVVLRTSATLIRWAPRVAAAIHAGWGMDSTGKAGARMKTISCVLSLSILFFSVPAIAREHAPDSDVIVKLVEELKGASTSRVVPGSGLSLSTDSGSRDQVTATAVAKQSDLLLTGDLQISPDVLSGSGAIQSSGAIAVLGAPSATSFNLTLEGTAYNLQVVDITSDP